jgi:signal transduction histidine kinase
MSNFPQNSTFTAIEEKQAHTSCLCGYVFGMSLLWFVWFSVFQAWAISPQTAQNQALQRQDKNRTYSVADSLERRIADLRQAGRTDSIFVSALIHLAEIDLVKRHDHLRGIVLASEAYSAAERLGLWLSAAHALSIVAANYQFIDRYDSALAAYRRLQVFTERHQVWQYYITALTQQGIYRNRGEYDIALACLLDAMRTFEKYHNDALQADVLGNMGRLYGTQGQFTEALGYLRRSLSLFTALKDARSQGFTLYYMGNVYRDAHRDSAAAAVYDEALRLFLRESDELHGRGLVLAELGNIYAQNKQYYQAEQTLSVALRELRTAGDNRSTAHTLNNLARMLCTLQRPKEALAQAQESYTLATSIGALKERLDAATTLADISERVGKTAQSLAWYKIALRVQDSLAQSVGAERIAALERKYNNEIKEREVTEIQRQNTIERLAVENQRNLLVLGVVSLVVVVVFAISRYRLKERSEMLLRRTNAQILEQQRELEAQASIIQATNTALQNANLQLETQNEELIALNNKKNEFLGIAAHDLRSPLANIVSLAAILQHNQLEKEEDDLSWTTQAIETSAAKMLTLIERLLDMNALERGGITLHHTDVDIAWCFRQSAERFQTQAEAKKIILLTSTDTTCYARADTQAVEQIADNLISNAIKYSPPEKRIWVTVESCKNSIRASVRDEGQGLSEADKIKVFTSFAKLSAKPTGGESSTGLGLAIVKTLTEMMQGTVRVESEYGIGATFIVEFPSAS